MSLDIELILHALSKGFEALEARWETRIPSSGVIHHGQEAASELPSPSPTTTTSAAAADNVAAPAATPDGADAGQKVLLAAPTINTKLVAAATSASASSTPTPGPAARAAVVENTSSTTPTRCSTQAPTPTPAPGNNAASLVPSSTPPTNSPTMCSMVCLSQQRYITTSTSAYSIGVVLPCLATKVQDAQKASEGLVVLNPVLLEPWPGIAVDMSQGPSVLNSEQVYIPPKPPWSLHCQQYDTSRVALMS